METHEIAYPLAVLNQRDEPQSLAGSAFPVSPDGGFLTCLHVVSRVDPDGAPVRVGLVDVRQQRVIPVEQYIAAPPEGGLDLAYMPRAAGRDTPCYLPLLPPGQVLIGTSVNLIGYHSGSQLEQFEVGAFKGAVVATPVREGHQQLRLPYPVIEGYSGAPLITYHNGTKVTGIAFGSESQRVQAYEVADIQDGQTHYRETVHRIVEFGLAYHASTIIAFLAAVGANATVSSDALDIPGLER